jgi:hypothetical protein
MPIVKKYGVVYELYMEQSGVDFGYIQIFTAWVTLISVHATTNTGVPGLLMILLYHSE